MTTSTIIKTKNNLPSLVVLKTFKSFDEMIDYCDSFGNDGEFTKLASTFFSSYKPNFSSRSSRNNFGKNSFVQLFEVIYMQHSLSNATLDIESGNSIIYAD